MATQQKKPVTHVYKEINEGKFKGVKHYELKEVINGTLQLTELINISKDRNCAQSMPEYWLKIRNDNKWSKCITGLFKTGINYIYKGDLQRKKHLILFKFSTDAKTLKVFVFKDFYTRDLSNVLLLINHSAKI
ncbi:hypothetical protein BXY75_3347 [Ulvibacter antarcticus]|uniref:Uncharacterized protein n=2 Tax=Ulvibacter antarcticus TaxID=442714 RepID=A0A3L9Y8E5_9FLAO|nr:hypothetical protein BXY75_3347 [Ulvibacter antarcticus]